MSVTLLIARHGNTFAPGETIRRVGLTDLPLVDSGVTQGYLLGNYLKNHQLIPDIIFTSQLQRTIQTAEAALSALQISIPMQAQALFDEIDYGPDENQAEQDVIARLGATALSAWDSIGLVPDGWRVNPAAIKQHWYDFAHMLQSQFSDKTVLVITSNGIARFAPCLTGDIATFSAKHGIKLATGALSVFQPSTAKRWHCLAWNIKPG